MLGRKRRSSLAHYQKNAAGEYIYTGSHYRYAGPMPRKRAFGLLWALLGTGSLMCLLAGVLPVPGMTGHFYVILPYMACLVLSMGRLWSLGQLTAAGDPIRQGLYDTSRRRLPGLNLASGVLAALSAMGEGYYLILHGAGDKAPFAAGYLVLLILAGALALAGSRVLRPMVWTEE